MLENKRLISQSVSKLSTLNSVQEDNFQNKIVLTPKKIVLIDRIIFQMELIKVKCTISMLKISNCRNFYYRLEPTVAISLSRRTIFKIKLFWRPV